MAGREYVSKGFFPVVTLLLSVCVAVVYTVLNHGRAFAPLGCGCTKGFNTNTLTEMIAVMLVVVAGASCLALTRSISWFFRITSWVAFAVAAAVFYRFFTYYNFWA